MVISVPPRAMRLIYRVAAPLAHIFWAVTRARMRGAKCVLLRGDAERREVLLVRHTYGNRRVWGLPGGLLKRGEEPIDGMLRELEEELGIRLADASELCVRDLRIFGHVDRVHFYLCELGDRSPELELNGAEIARADWFAIEDPPRPLGEQVPEVLALLASQPGTPGSPARG